ncbi:MAG TPA: hypothetical protein ENJ90_06790 [Devosia sp.]|nr:hypothetical protein [Devosia sp.]
MSRLDDLIDLIQTTNEVYFITAPGRVRTAFILVDDIIELALKTFLQEKALEQREQCQQALKTAGLVTSSGHRSALRRYFTEEINRRSLGQSLGVSKDRRRSRLLTRILRKYPLIQHWSVNQPDNFRNYYQVVEEVKQFFPSGDIAHSLLGDAFDRHKLRNKFYHDHQQSGLTIDDDKCLRALCGMFDLMEHLFPHWLAHVQTYDTVRCQIGVLRLKKAALSGRQEVVDPYNDALNQLKRDHRYDRERRSVEHSLVHTVSDRFFRALREQFENKIAELQYRINQIDSMKRPQQRHRDERADKQRLVNILQQQLDEINALLGTP